jgi:hypothetical protein
LDLKVYGALRPTLYHCTAASNLPSIRSERAIHSPAVLDPTRCTLQRLAAVQIIRGKYIVTLRDQLALKQGNVDLQGGWSWVDFLAALNGRVFFWPEIKNGYGGRFWQKYRLAEEAILRVSLRELLLANPGTSPQFSKFNSGAPRCVGGRPSPRGPDTFLTLHEWLDRPSRVREVSFVGSVYMPPATEVWDGERGWQQVW